MRALQPMHAQPQHSSSGSRGCSVPQAELPVAGGVGVPVGEGLHPALEPRALHDHGGERRRGHVCGVRRACAGGRGAASMERRSFAVKWSSIWRRWNWLSGSSAGAHVTRANRSGARSPPGFCSAKHAHAGFVTSDPRPPAPCEPLHCAAPACPRARLLLPTPQLPSHPRAPFTAPPVNGAAHPLATVLLECCGASAH